MASESGFDPLFATIRELSAERCSDLFVPAQVPPPGRWTRLLHRFGFRAPPRDPIAPTSPFVAPRHEWLSGKVLEAARANPGDWILLSVGECQYCGWLAVAPPEVRKRIILFCHQPVSWMRLFWRDWCLFDGLGAIVCLGRKQGVLFKKLAKSPVIMMRHGVVGDFFKPAPDSRGIQEPRLLFVGHWLRDFETLLATYKIVAADYPNIRLDCVIPMGERFHPALLELAKFDGVCWHSGLSAGGLLHLYQSASLLLMPVVDASANNAVVEAFACGLPVVATSVGDMGDYVAEPRGCLCEPHDAVSHAAAVMAYLKDSELRTRASGDARDFAVNELDWRKIAPELLGKIKSTVA